MATLESDNFYSVIFTLLWDRGSMPGTSSTGSSFSSDFQCQKKIFFFQQDSFRFFWTTKKKKIGKKWQKKWERRALWDPSRELGQLNKVAVRWKWQRLFCCELFCRGRRDKSPMVIMERKLAASELRLADSWQREFGYSDARDPLVLASRPGFCVCLRNSLAGREIRRMVA